MCKPDQDRIQRALENAPPQDPAHFRETMESGFQTLDSAMEVVRELGWDDHWRKVSDEELVEVLKKTGPDGKFDELAKSIVARLDLDGCDPTEWTQIVSIGLQACATREFVGRGLARESADGRAVREFLNERDEPKRKHLVRSASKGLTWHPEYPNPQEAKEEIVSMAHLGLTERIKRTPDPGRELDRWLLDFVRAERNKIPDRVRRSVKERLEGIKRGKKGLVEIRISANAKGESRSPQEIDRVLRELAVEPEGEENIRLQELISHCALDPTDRELLLLLSQGATQKQAAKRLRVTQSAISQRLRRIRSKLGT